MVIKNVFAMVIKYDFVAMVINFVLFWLNMYTKTNSNQQKQKQ